MSYEHESGLPGAHDRAVGQADQQMVVFSGDRPLQGAELNEVQTIIRSRHGRVSGLFVKDGDRQEGAEALVDIEEGTVTLAAGRIYAAGDVFPVAPATLTDVPMSGRATLGIRVRKDWVTAQDRPELLGLVPGTEAEGEEGAGREIMSIAWALPDDGQPGQFVPVYSMIDGTIIDQTPPPALSGVMQQIGVYDYDANGHYIVDGCNVTCIGKVGLDWIYSISAGTANIQGYKRIREASLRFPVPEEVELEDIVAEVHNYAAPTGQATTINLHRAPMQSLTSLVIVKRSVESVLRGNVPSTPDPITHASVYEIESVVQGPTTYVRGVNFEIVNGEISWIAGQAQPAGSSQYTVTYLYSEAVVPDDMSDRSITVSGGVQGKPITVRYLSKIPRIDLICLDISGAPKYVKGIPARRNALAPIEPGNLLKLAEVHNDWLNLPVIVNNGVRNYTYAQMRRLFGRLVDMLDQFDRQTALNSITASSPVAKKGIFTDTFVDDFFRDQGVSQTAACNQGVLQLAIDPVMLELVSNSATVRPYSHRVVLSQDLRTSSMKVNPYASFTRMPAGMRIDPAVDFWTETQTEWLSDVTREFSAAPDQPPSQSVINEVTELRRDVARFLRQNPVNVLLEGFGIGEKLKTLTFDGVDVKPAGEQIADENGEIALTFDIPANVPVGTKVVRAEGMVASFAEARYVGEGVIDVSVMRRVHLVAREAAAPVINNITNITQITNVTVNEITQQVIPNVELRGPNGGRSTGEFDPLAQTFSVPAPYMVTGVNFWLAAVGDRDKGIRVQLATTTNGYPTAEVLAEAFISMATVAVGDKIEARFDLPVYLAPWRQYCFVFMTDDAEHALHIARLGDIIVETQEQVGANPYNIGMLFSSANRLTWTAHQDADLAFEVVAAEFDADDDEVVDLWTGDLDTISDLLIRGTVEVPTEEAGFHYELVRANGQVIKVQPGQALQFDSFVDEQVTLRAVLSGNDRISPILYPGTMIAGGRLRTAGDYVTRAFPFGSNVDLSALMAARLPIGSDVAVSVSVDGGAWQDLAESASEVLGDGWIEPKYERGALTGSMGRVKIALSGTPGARPSLAMLRAYTI